MSSVHVYIQPFDHLGNYSGTWTEVTSDVDWNGISTIKTSLDNTDYDVGVLRNSNFKIRLRNDHGYYSDVDGDYTIFENRRTGSLVKVTWEPGDFPFLVGITPLGANSILTTEEEIYRGLLDDQATIENVDDYTIEFNILGLESIFDRVEVPYSTIGATDNFSDVLYDLFNQSEITDIMTVSATNISPSTDSAMDNKTSLENTTVKAALRKILLAANSVVYVDSSQVLYCKGRTAGTTSVHTFYGPGSSDGFENIIDIREFRLGRNRLINHATFTDSTTAATDSTSISINGVHTREVSCDLITTGATISTLLANIVSEFGTAKKEMKLTAPLNTDTIGIGLLDRVTIDFPSIALPPQGFPVAIYGQGVYGTHYYAYETSQLVISSSDAFKVLEKSIDLKKDTVTFRLREI